MPRTTIQAAAGLGRMAAAINLYLPIPLIERGDHSRAPDFGLSSELILSIFRWRALALLAYVGLAICKPAPGVGSS